jgi:hypothetical protein
MNRPNQPVAAMTIFYDPVAGVTNTDNCSSVVARRSDGKPVTETITSRKGFSFVKTFYYDADGKYAGASFWERQQ